MSVMTEHWDGTTTEVMGPRNWLDSHQRKAWVQSDAHVTVSGTANDTVGIIVERGGSL